MTGRMIWHPGYGNEGGKPVNVTVIDDGSNRSDLVATQARITDDGSNRPDLVEIATPPAFILDAAPFPLATLDTAAFAATIDDKVQAFQQTHTTACGPLAGPIASPQAAGTDLRVLVGGCLVPALRHIDPRFFVALDFEDRELGIFMLGASLPTAFVMGSPAAPSGFCSVPLIWTPQSVVIGSTPTTPAVVVHLGGPHAGAKLLDTLNSLAATFFAAQAVALEVVQ